MAGNLRVTMYMWRRNSGQFLVVLVTIAGCRPTSVDSRTEQDQTDRSGQISRPQSSGAIQFFAASSATDAVEEVRRNFERQTGYRVELNLEGSSTLAHQIAQGAEADLFLSANEQWANWVVTTVRGGNRVLERVELLTNELVVVVPAASPLEISSLDDLLQPAVENLALADPASVPAGIYAKESLQNLNLWEKLRPKVVAGDNVRTAIYYVEIESAQAGIVYATDAAISPGVRVAARIDPSLHTPVRYPLMLMRHATKQPGSREFFEYLTGPEATEVFEKYGFTMLHRPDIAQQEATR